MLCAAETSSEVHGNKTHSALDNVSPHFAWYGQSIESINSEPLDVIFTQSPYLL